MDTTAGKQQSYVIDPNFEPQSRDRANTFPLCRNNVANNVNNEEENNVVNNVVKIDAAISEEEYYDVRGNYTTLSPSDPNVVNMQNMLVTEHTPLQHTNSTPTFGTRLDSEPIQQTPFLQSTSLQSHEQQQTTAPSSNAATPATQKAKSSSRKNAWGSQSYADLITEAIESSPEKRLTLAQIYEYMVKNIEYFSDKGESNSSAGWKNSIRHNLSLHDKFKRIQNEGTGKSSWWTINYNAKPGKSPRRRVQSMDTGHGNKNLKNSAARARKKTQDKSKKAGKYNSSPPFPYSPNSDDKMRNDFSGASCSGYRARSHSNASSLNGHISPSRSRLDGGGGEERPLSPPDDNNFLFNSQQFTGYPGIGERFNEMVDNVQVDISAMALQPDGFPNNLYGGASNLSNSLTSSIPRNEDSFLNVLSNHGSLDTSSANNAVNSSPNLANLLLQPGTSKNTPVQNVVMTRGSRGNDVEAPRARSNTMPGRPPMKNVYKQQRQNSTYSNNFNQSLSQMNIQQQQQPTTKARHASATQASSSTQQQQAGGANLTSLLTSPDTSQQQQQRMFRNNQQQPRNRGYSMGANTARPNLHQMDSGIFEQHQRFPQQSIKSEPISQYTQLENMQRGKDGNFFSPSEDQFSNLNEITIPQAEQLALQNSINMDSNNYLDIQDINLQDMDDIHQMAFGPVMPSDVLVKMETQQEASSSPAVVQQHQAQSNSATDIYFNTTHHQPPTYCQPTQPQQQQYQQYFMQPTPMEAYNTQEHYRSVT